MCNELQVVCGWTVIRGKRDLKRFEKENWISYSAGAVTNFPCLAQSQLDSDENPRTEITTKEELEEMLAALKK